MLCHNDIRDEIYGYCRRGRLGPELEAGGLLHQLSLPHARRRPADVLCCSGGALLPALPDGTRVRTGRRVALDFAVVNALGQGHVSETLQGALTAAAAYSQRKRRHDDTQAKCAAEGIVFEPMVFEAQGGVEKRCAAVLHCIAEAVATAEERDPAVIKQELLQRIGLALLRSNARAVRRRAPPVEAATRRDRRLIGAAAVATAAGDVD